MLTGQTWGVLIARRRAPPPHPGIREGFLEEVTQKWVEWQCVVCVVGEGGPLARGCSNKRQVNNMKENSVQWHVPGTKLNWSWWQKAGEAVPASPVGTSCGRPGGSEPPSQHGAEAHQGHPSSTALPTAETTCAML